MLIKAGIFLKSTKALNNTVFEYCIIFLSEYNSNDAIGFVINKPFIRKLNELEEFKHSPSFPLYDGGPVDKEHLFFMHQRPDLITNGIFIGENIYVGGNFKQAINCINNKSITAEEIKIFIGYCGWDAGELENEIEEGSWIVDEGKNGFMK